MIVPATITFLLHTVRWLAAYLIHWPPIREQQLKANNNNNKETDEGERKKPCPRKSAPMRLVLQRRPLVPSRVANLCCIPFFCKWPHRDALTPDTHKARVHNTTMRLFRRRWAPPSWARRRRRPDYRPLPRRQRWRRRGASAPRGSSYATPCRRYPPDWAARRTGSGPTALYPTCRRTTTLPAPVGQTTSSQQPVPKRLGFPTNRVLSRFNWTTSRKTMPTPG